MQFNERAECLIFVSFLHKCTKKLILFHLSNSLCTGVVLHEAENIDLSSLRWGCAGKENVSAVISIYKVLSGVCGCYLFGLRKLV